MTVSVFGAKVALTRTLLGRSYKRDREGKFSSGGAGGGGGGGGSPEQLHDDEATIRATFTYHDEATGMRAEVTDIRQGGEHSPTYVNIRITDRNGTTVGNANRTILPAGQRTVRHDGMALTPGMQGQGFAARFNAHTEEVYRANGIERITTYADIDVGGYSHARAGFDFADGNARASALVHIATQANRYPQAVRDEINRHIRNDQVTPVELAMIGHTPGATTWPGKELMLGSAWEGVKVL